MPDSASRPLDQLISLNGKTAIVTGAAMGIGRAIALRFAEAGADLELVDINAEQLASVGNEASSSGTSVNVHSVDLSQRREIETFWNRLSDASIDILVNNAGIYPIEPFLEIDEDDLERVLRVNLKSAFWMCQELIRRRRKRGGSIVNVGSIEAILPFKSELCHYAISKAGVMAMTRDLAREYGGWGYRVNAVVPGGVVTPGTKQVAKMLFKMKLDLIPAAIDFKRRISLGRMGEPDEVARIVLVLASELASYMNGALVPVDGGFLSH